MTDETKATVSETVNPVSNADQIKAEAERTAREVAERKARSLDFTENYRESQKAEKEERARRAASSNRARAKAEEEKRLREEAERAAREEARRKEREEFEARAKRNAAMLNEIDAEEARRKEEEAAEARKTQAAPSPITRPESPKKVAEPIRQTPAPKPAAPITNFFEDETAVETEDLLSAVRIDGSPLGNTEDADVVVLGLDESTEDKELADLIEIHAETPTAAEPTAPKAKAPKETPASEQTVSTAATAPAYPAPDDYIKAWNAAYGENAPAAAPITEGTTYEEAMKQWQESCAAALAATPAYAEWARAYGLTPATAPNQETAPAAKEGASVGEEHFAPMSTPHAVSSRMLPMDDEDEEASPVSEAEMETVEEAVEQKVEETADEVAEEEETITEAAAVDPFAQYLKEQNDKIAERRAARNKTKLPDKLNVQADICNLYFEALHEIYQSNAKKYRKLYRNGAKREIDIYNDMLRKCTRKDNRITFIPVDQTIPNRLLKGEAPEALFVKHLQKETPEEAAKRKEKLFRDIETLETPSVTDDFAKWLTEQEEAVNEKKTGFKALALPDRLAAQESVLRIYFEVLRRICRQKKTSYKNTYRAKAKNEITLYNDLARTMKKARKTVVPPLALNIPDRLLKGEDFDPFANNTAQNATEATKKAGKKVKEKKAEDTPFSRYLAEKNAAIRDAKSRYDLTDHDGKIRTEREVCSLYFDILEQICIQKKKSYASTYKSRALTELNLYNSLLRKANRHYEGDRTPIAKTVPERILRGELSNPLRAAGTTDEALMLLTADNTAPVSASKQKETDLAYLAAKATYEISRRQKCYYTARLSFLSSKKEKTVKKEQRRMKKAIRTIKHRVKPVEKAEIFFNAKYYDLTEDKRPARKRKNALAVRKLRERITALLAERDRINARLIELYEYDTWKPASLGKRTVHSYLNERAAAAKRLEKTAKKVKAMHLPYREEMEILRILDQITELHAEIKLEKQLCRKQKKGKPLSTEVRVHALEAELYETEDKLAAALHEAEFIKKRARKQEKHASGGSSAYWIVLLLIVIGLAAAAFYFKEPIAELIKSLLP